MLSSTLLLAIGAGRTTVQCAILLQSSKYLFIESSQGIQDHRDIEHRLRQGHLHRWQIAEAEHSRI